RPPYAGRSRIRTHDNRQSSANRAAQPRARWSAATARRARPRSGRCHLSAGTISFQQPGHFSGLLTLAGVAFELPTIDNRVRTERRSRELAGAQRQPEGPGRVAATAISQPAPSPFDGLGILCEAAQSVVPTSIALNGLSPDHCRYRAANQDRVDGGGL